MTRRALERGWSPPSPGDAIAGKYEVESVLGWVGGAVILTATQLGFGQRVAIRLLSPERASDPRVVDAFLREGQAATTLQSEHVARVFEVGMLDEGHAPFAVFEYLEGHTLQQVIANWGPLPVATATDWMLQVAEAVAEALARGVTVRDIHPSAIFLSRQADGGSCLKLVDLGLDASGEPSPSDTSVVEQSTISGIGATLYELVSGEPPFAGTPERQGGRDPSARSQVPPALGGVIVRCLSQDPSARFATLVEMAYALMPFGTLEARASYERIAHMQATGGLPAGEITPLPPLASDETDLGRLSRPSDASLVRQSLGSQASARVVVGSVLLLTAIGVAGLMFMYDSVHSGDARAAGVTSLQATGQGALPAASSAASTETPASATTLSLAAPTPARSSASSPVEKPSDPATANPVTAKPVVTSVPITSLPRAVDPSPARARSTPPPPARPHPVETPPVRAARPPGDTPGHIVTVYPEPAPHPERHDDAPSTPPPSGDDLFDGRK